MDLIDVRDLSKPTSKLSFSSIEKKIHAETFDNEETDSPKKKVTLLEFVRMYTISKIPIMDFIIMYIILYSLNCIYVDCDFKIVSVGTIPLTILLNMLFNDNFVESFGVILVFAVSAIATIYMAIM